MFTFPAVKNPIIAALDVPDAEQAIKLAEAIAPAVGAFKIGKELFVSAGPDIVKRVRDTGASVFLDLKFHDIPNTVAKAVASAVRLDVQMLTVHASGGSAMLMYENDELHVTGIALAQLGAIRDPSNPLSKDIRTAPPAFKISYMGMNSNVPPFDDRNVRQALNYAIDKETIARVDLDGH